MNEIYVDYDLIDQETKEERGFGHDKKFSHTIPAVKYDVVIKKDKIRMNLSVDLKADVSGVVIIDDLTPFLSGISIPYFTPKLGYGLNVSAPIGGASLTFNYSGIDIDEDMLRVYKCDDWDVTGRTCLSSWKRVWITLDRNNDLIRFSVPGFSGFVVGESALSTINVSGIALDYYTGKKINGNITAIPLENPENKKTSIITNGEWSMSLDVLKVEHLTFVVESTEKKGYNELKLPTPSEAELNCRAQNISLS
ncbi:MAG: hypothetical protein ACTSYJ_09110, partial [Candidatus Thorarchaeota archaeon]